MKSLIGIEFGEGTVSIFQKKKDGAEMLFKDVPITEEFDMDFTERDMQISVIKELMDSECFDGKDCAVVLPERYSFFRTLYMAPMTDDELKINLPFEFKDYVGDEMNKYTYDYALNNVFYDENDVATEMEIFAAAGLTKAVDNIESVIEEAGLRLNVVIPREMAIINCFRYANETERPVPQEYCMLTIGYSSSRVDIYDGGVNTASKMIDFGMSAVDEAISAKYGVTLKDAIEYRKNNFEDVLDSAECKRQYEMLQLEIMKAINFYKYEHQDSDFQEIHFVGMDSNCPQLRASVAAGLGMRDVDIYDILPIECKGLADACRGIGAIGVTL